MTKLTLFESALDENTYRTAKVEGWCNLTQPDVAVGVPATDLPGQLASATIRHPFDDEMVVASQEPTDMLIAPCTPVETPNGPFALSRS